VKGLRAAIVVFLVVGLIAIFHTGPTGDSNASASGGTMVSAASDPLLIGWSVIAVGLFAVLMTIETKVTVGGTAKLKRRAAAFTIDLLFTLTILSSLAALLPLWLEARRTGHFAWHFERDYAVRTDVVIVPTVLFVMAMVFLYFVYPLTRDKQTIGSFVMRVKVTPPFGDVGRFTFREALRRTGYVLLGMATWQWARKDFVDDEDRTWWDRKTNTRVALVGDS
jgi:hypothetical protein